MGDGIDRLHDRIRSRAQWLSYLPKSLEGKWQPVELAGTLAVTLVAGKYDALTGRWVGPEDDLDEMMRRIEKVEKDEL